MSRSRQKYGGFTLTETLTALGLSVIILTAFYAAAGQAIRTVRLGRETASATQLLQQRLESFHSAKLWSYVSTPSDFTTMVTDSLPAMANFPGVVETYTITAYPAGTPSFTATRNANGTVSTSGASLPATQKCVTITGQLTWTGAGNVSRSRTQATLLTKGGF
ncbi:PulJ/GspJ family protein [Verrucomicrobiota bacterium sgz303538]